MGVATNSERGVALVTGCSSGFGMLSAVTLAGRGFRVFATMRDLARRGPLDEAAARAGASLDVLALDVTDPRAIGAAVERVRAEAGPVDVLVNNAGVGVLGALEDMTMAEVREMFETNFFGAVALTKAVVPSMRERRRGRIINVSSVGGRLGLAGNAGYTASKFALEGLSESLRMELRPFGVHVVLVEPGMFPTTMVGVGRRVTRAAKEPGSAYRATVAFLERTMDQNMRGGPSPQRVADAVAHAAMVHEPALRYPVGTDARLFLTLHRLLPGRSFEWLSARAIERMLSVSVER